MLELKWVPPPGGIYKIKWPALPDWHFEWHSIQGKVWAINLAAPPVIRNGEKQHEAACIAEHVTDHGTAFNFVQTWIRGYNEGLKAVPNLLITSNQQALGA